ACGEARTYRFAAVVVPPCFVPIAISEMGGTGIPVCSVVAFPFGWEIPATKSEQTERLLDSGVDEIDMVMNVPQFLSGRPEIVTEEVAAVARLCRGQAILKLIIETACLGDGQIAEAARLGADSGADYIKTSTGYASRGATVEDVRIIKQAIGDRCRIKASGKIRTRDQALSLVNAGAARLGCSASLDLIL
ncbi:MAG: deoxyribose-phosphate aldolase, partial [bacterium]